MSGEVQWEDVEIHDVKPGDIAAHVDGLDPREVTRVTPEGIYVYLLFKESGPFPITNYTFTRRVN